MTPVPPPINYTPASYTVCVWNTYMELVDTFTGGLTDCVYWARYKTLERPDGLINIVPSEVEL